MDLYFLITPDMINQDHITKSAECQNKNVEFITLWISEKDAIEDYYSNYDTDTPILTLKIKTNTTAYQKLVKTFESNNNILSEKITNKHLETTLSNIKQNIPSTTIAIEFKDIVINFCDTESLSDPEKTLSAHDFIEIVEKFISKQKIKDPATISM